MTLSTSEKQDSTKPDATARVLSIGQFCVAILAICITIGGCITSGVNSLRTDISDIKQDQALVKARLDRQEEKTRGYDLLITQRNQQWSDLGERLARIEALLGELPRKRQVNPL